MKIFATLLLMVLLSSSGFGQTLSPSVISSAGQENASSSIQLSWTLGELAINDFFTGFGLLTEGFHQPQLSVQEITSDNAQVTDVEAYAISVFPNPVSNSLVVINDTPKSQLFNVILYDTQAKVHYKETILNGESEFTIDVSSLAQGIYFLHFLNPDNEQKQVFRISKN